MKYVIDGYDSSALRFFEEIAAIPRVSFHEKEIADYIEAFARQRGLDVYRDAANNVLVKKQGTSGREGEDTILLQAHTDMVGEKRADSTHDLLREGIRLLQEGSLLRADGTTLGADDGFGVALMLSVLAEGRDHPPLECLFTATEETGLVGASQFDYSRVRAVQLVNLDSSEEADIVIGCCGGHHSHVECDLTVESTAGMGIAITVSGLCGGHSGEDIHRGRANAITVMQRLVSRVQREMPLRIADVCCEGRSNVIPRACSALIAVEDTARAMMLLQEECEACRADCVAKEDAGLCFVLSLAPYTALITEADSARLWQLLTLPQGVLVWRDEAEKVPFLSCNIGSVSVQDGRALLVLSTRCSQNEVLDARDAEMAAFAERLGARLVPISAYGGWESGEEIDLVRRWRDAYRRVTGGEMHVTVIHAGLECGVICAALPGMDAISVGCNIRNLHSPDECMDLDSFARVERTLYAFLAT